MRSKNIVQEPPFSKVFLPHAPAVRITQVTAPLIALVISLFLSSPILADDNKPTFSAADELQLITLRKDILTIENSLQLSRDSKTGLVEQLKLSEIHISKLSKLIRATDTELKRQKVQLEKMRSARKSLNQKVKDYRQQLALQIRSSHAIGQQDYLKILLSAQHPADVSRMLTYLNYLNRQQLTLIKEAKLSHSELKKSVLAIKSRRKLLEKDRKQQQSDLEKLTLSKQSRIQLLSKIGEIITSKQQKLQTLKNDQFNLSQLLHQFLQQSTPTPPDVSITRLPFKKLKGKLNRPTAGKIIRKFGQAHIGNIRSKGLVFASKSNQPVLAVAAGKVVYSDWLRGFGMLMILDHGNQYMSLYGQNTSLNYEPGDWVQAQETIAITGNSGGKRQSGLYFEIRHRGEPINPLKWLKP